MTSLDEEDMKTSTSAATKARFQPKRSPKREKPTRVFLIGAGVSASHGIAVAKDILRAAVVGLQEGDASGAKLITQLIEYLYPSFRGVLLNYPNIEDFLNLLEMAKTFNSAEFIQSTVWPTKRLDEATARTLKAVTDYIWAAMRPEPRHIEDFIRHCIEPDDVIIDFNWDLNIERALVQVDLLFWYEKPTDVLLLKPHGSVDWFELEALPTKTQKAVQRLDDELVVYPQFDFAEYRELRDVAPVIVPPVSSKQFDRPFLKQTWKAIYRAISAASELWIIGYSLPKEDQFARLVLGRAIRNNALRRKKNKKRGQLAVKVVNPDEFAGYTYARLVGENGKVEFFQTPFETFVAGLRSGAIEP